MEPLITDLELMTILRPFNSFNGDTAGGNSAGTGGRSALQATAGVAGDGVEATETDATEDLRIFSSAHQRCNCDFSCFMRSCMTRCDHACSAGSND